MRLIVTAGPTIEPIDEVRCISNFSSGRMGFEIAKSAVERGHNVVLISGPVNIAAPESLQFQSIRTSEELFEAILENFESCDALVMAAAVCDYRPVRVVTGKMKKEMQGITLQLVPTRDILLTIAKDKARRIVAGFALETENGIINAREKCHRKNCDMVFLNPPSSLHGDRTEITIVYADGSVRPLPFTTKTDAAKLILMEIEAAFDASIQRRR